MSLSVLFIMLYKVVLIFMSLCGLNPQCVTIQMKAIEQYFHMELTTLQVLRNILKAWLNEILVCDKTCILLFSGMFA